MTNQHPAIDDPVARELLDALLSYLPIFESPGYCFGVRHPDDWFDQKLSSESKTFIQKSLDLYLRLLNLLPGAHTSKQHDLALRIANNDEALCATTDLTVLCLALRSRIRVSDVARGGLGILTWFESESFLPLLRHIEELYTRRAEQPHE